MTHPTDQSSREQELPLVQSTAPESIYLDLGWDFDMSEPTDFYDIDEVTWSGDNASGNGIKYVRADLAEQRTRAMREAQEQAVIASFLEQTGQYVTNDASRAAAVLAAFDAAVAIELPCVSVVPYNSHDICEWFAANVRARLTSTPPSAPGNGEGDAAPHWATCESRGPWVRNSLKARIGDLRDGEKMCRRAYKQEYMGEPTKWYADALGEAAAVLERRLAILLPPAPAQSGGQE